MKLRELLTLSQIPHTSTHANLDIEVTIQACWTGWSFSSVESPSMVVMCLFWAYCACTVHIDGDAVRSCSFAAQYAQNKHITTIEGLSTGEKLHPVQQAWIEEIVPQCGYCQPGFMMSVANLLEKIPNPTDEEIDDNITNICRCGTYYRMRKAIHRAASLKKWCSVFDIRCLWIRTSKTEKQTSKIYIEKSNIEIKYGKEND